ncbi:hypothetical protein, partial [Enterobacter hormaechei]
GEGQGEGKLLRLQFLRRALRFGCGRYFLGLGRPFFRFTSVFFGRLGFLVLLATERAVWLLSLINISEPKRHN